MQIRPLRQNLIAFARKRGLWERLTKQIALFEANPRHPSLHTERLEPKGHKLYSFRIDRKYRVIFIVVNAEEVEVVDINNHYA